MIFLYHDECGLGFETTIILLKTFDSSFSALKGSSCFYWNHTRQFFGIKRHWLNVVNKHDFLKFSEWQMNDCGLRQVDPYFIFKIYTLTFDITMNIIHFVVKITAKITLIFSNAIQDVLTYKTFEYSAFLH